MLNVAVVGATGYTGVEIIKILLRHPRVRITSLSAKVERPVKIQEEFPELVGSIDLGSFEGAPFLFLRPQIEEDGRCQRRHDNQHENPFQHRRPRGRSASMRMVPIAAVTGCSPAP